MTLRAYCICEHWCDYHHQMEPHPCGVFGCKCDRMIMAGKRDDRKVEQATNLWGEKQEMTMEERDE